MKTKTAQTRWKQVLRAIDVIAAKDQLAFLTTQRISQQSGISDGVLFRHFSSKEAMLTAWIETRAEQLRLLLDAMPAGRGGLIYLQQQLLQQDPLLSFLCCQPMDTPYLRQALDASRLQFVNVVQTRIELMSSTPIGITSDVLTDHLMQSIYRAWNPDNNDRDRQKERLMSQLPWEKNKPNDTTFPAPEVMQRLALNDSGFVFDPVNGKSFTANETCIYALRFLQHSNDAEALLVAISRDFEVSQSDAARDITEFSSQLRKFLQ
ncbi:TetR family transcriptional regulator [Mariprofundus sp. EBB-1]|uniref:PqqD family peptide modification chaperone n=1 Tax=Mariprofundus sp. EBB-1 TaxID=2650971 RepID=UPI000EF1EE27|nr:PqqD family peptide modification chaperone [Mariprofundus sp. EBB-1]RLL51335.1 TetR family transcriptional regulator [Mariprofundus sp. EBB-1]